jgi:RNA polymerase sigma-70 factor (ECF subfamily)
MSSLPEPGAAPNFETWFRKSAAQLLRQAYYFTRDPELAEDIAQDAAVKVFKAWPDEETRSKILTQPGYVRAIVYHCFLDYIKVPSRTNHREAELAIERYDRSDREIDHDLRRAVLGLADDERDMILLRYYNGLTIREAGNQLGLSPAQAYRLHDKALASLAGLLDEGEAWRGR